MLKSSKAHRATKLFVLLWCGIFIYCWLNEIELARNEQQLARGFFAITAVNFGTVLNALLAAKFNIYFRSEGGTILEQNSLYSKKINIFPGFSSSLDISITALQCHAVFSYYAHHGSAVYLIGLKLIAVLQWSVFIRLL